MVGMEGFGKVKKFYYLIGTRTRNLLACSIAPLRYRHFTFAQICLKFLKRRACSVILGVPPPSYDRLPMRVVDPYELSYLSAGPILSREPTRCQAGRKGG
jgi:hypothetical protein